MPDSVLADIEAKYADQVLKLLFDDKDEFNILKLAGGQEQDSLRRGGRAGGEQPAGRLLPGDWLRLTLFRDKFLRGQDDPFTLGFLRHLTDLILNDEDPRGRTARAS